MDTTATITAGTVREFMISTTQTINVEALGFKVMSLLPGTQARVLAHRRPTGLGFFYFPILSMDLASSSPRSATEIENGSTIVTAAEAILDPARIPDTEIISSMLRVDFEIEATIISVERGTIIFDSDVRGNKQLD